jgi:uncharacterized OsmC-like protein
VALTELRVSSTLARVGQLFFRKGVDMALTLAYMVERLANQDKIPLQWMDVSVEAYRDPDTKYDKLTVYDAIRVHFEMWGVQAEQAEGLVETWKRR